MRRPTAPTGIAPGVALWLAMAASALAARIGVLEEPGRAQALAAAADAALGRAVAAAAPLEPGEPLAAAAALCRLAEAGAGDEDEEPAACALAGGDERAARLAAAAAARAGLPLLAVDPWPADATWEALALHPHPDVLARACVELCREKGWKRAALLHEGSASPAAALAAAAEDAGLELVLLARRLPPPAEPTLLRNLLLVLKKSGVTRFAVWGGAAATTRVLDAAQRVGLLDQRHEYLLLDLDLHTRPLADYSHGGANVTALRLFDPEDEHIVRLMGEWRRRYEGWASFLGDGPAPPTALVLAMQGAAVADEALRRLALPRLARGSCRRATAAFHADTLLNYIRSGEWTSVDGGSMSWEADGARRDLPLQVVELARGGQLRPAGLWAARSGLRWGGSRPLEPPPPPPPAHSLTNRTFTVLIALNPPYVMRRESQERRSGNDRYEGFCIELIERLGKQLNFNYTFVETSGGYGSYDKKLGKWTGMLGRLMEDNSTDFAITDLTITAERERAVDFTTPFMNLGIAILFHAPTEPEPELFAFLLPFSNEVWLYLGFAYLVTSLVLYVVGRLCHEEWQNPYPCVEEPTALENQFTLGNALWFNLGAVLLQGSEIAPVAYGTRAVASVWWVFALVITSSYTANLATLLAQKSSNEAIHGVQDLVNNSLGIDYGAKAGGSTYTFFEHSQNEQYQQMFEYMKDKSMPTSNEEGIKKVQQGNYAFLMESTSIDYEIERKCDVVKVGSPLDNKGYGIAMRKGSEYRQEMNLGLLRLQEAGALREMTETWWSKKHGGGACKKPDNSESKELEISNFRGLFLVLAVGCALGVAVSACDLAWAAWRRARAQRTPFWRLFCSELRFVFRFERSVKPLHGPLSGSPREAAPSPSPSPSPSPQPEPEPERGRVGSLQPGALRGRRRSSMHAASARLARHARERDSATPAGAGR